MKGSEESGAVSKFWKDLDNSAVWRHDKDLAERGDMSAIVAVTDLFYLIGVNYSPASSVTN